MNQDQHASAARLRAGGIIFISGQLAPLLIPLVTNSTLSATWKTALSGLLLVGVPEIAILLTVMVLGKAGFHELKRRVLGSLRNTVFPDTVSRQRYYVGLVLLAVPILFGWLSPYLYESITGLTHYRFGLAIVGDALLIFGLVLLGGQFWDKLRSLVVYDAAVTAESESDVV